MEIKHEMRLKEIIAKGCPQFNDYQKAKVFEKALRQWEKEQKELYKALLEALKEG